MGKNGRILFDRPKPTAGCSASGIIKIIIIIIIRIRIFNYLQDRRTVIH
jgi:hypothetical protein